jgi:serine/threonine-protein kinase
MSGMKICARCNQTHDANERFCPKCGMVLVDPEDIDRVGKTIGNYHVKRILGRGGMGTVYEGEHVYIGKRVAMKILHSRYAKYEDAVKRFLREARAASAIEHPNIVDVTDFGPTEEGGVFFVMEYLEGTSLEDLIEKRGAIELHRALNVANQMALALAAAHEKGVIHRDLKPDNIYLIKLPGRRDLVKAMGNPGSANPEDFIIEKENEYDFVKIFDFGIAKVLTPDQFSPKKTAQGAVFGTPEYMSPEAAKGMDVDHRSDIYSLGVILYDMITGRPPFEAEAASDVLQMQITKEVPPPTQTAPHMEITPATEELILRALAKDPGGRHQSMDQFRAELQGCYGTVRYKRNASAFEATANDREKKLTDDVSEWVRTHRTTEEERLQSLVDQADSSFSSAQLTSDEEARLGAALEAALDDDD